MEGVVGSTRLGAELGLLATGFMLQLFEAEAEELVLWIAGLAVLLAVAIYVIERVRATPAQHEPTASELLAKCRESHSRGELSDEEFRTIRTKLGSRLREELKDDGEEG
jgi:uncharacterized membrane protein